MLALAKIMLHMDETGAGFKGSSLNESAVHRLEPGEFKFQCT